MLLTITTTHNPVTDLGYLLHKHPDKLQSVSLTIGKAHIFYPESNNSKSTIALLLDIDPINMVRGGRKLAGKKFALGQYVNDRPYVASSFMSVAIAKAFSTAMNGKCKEKPSLVNTKIPLQAKIAVVSAPRGGENLIRKIFEPLGYQVDVEKHILDEKFTDWGDSKFFTITLSQNIELKNLLSHLYVLIPALDNDKHYFVSENEIEKLLGKGKGWLENHPNKEIITKRYLNNIGSLTKQALVKLNEDNNDIDESKEEKLKKESLHQQRLQIVFEKLKATKAKKVIDLGCGEGKLLKMLLRDWQFETITGMDVSYAELLKCKSKLRWDEMPPKLKQRISIFQGALTYKDEKLANYDAAAIVEVIEHLDQNRLTSFEKVVFKYAKPKTVIVTTPNKEYNVMYESLNENSMRHSDHRFEWTRNEFENWANNVAKNFGYIVSFEPIGDVNEKVGAPSQMAIFNYDN